MEKKDIYSSIKVITLDKMRIAKYVVISADPEGDSNAFMDKWAEKSGLLSLSGYKKRKIGWDFPFLSQEQFEKFRLHGYVSAYIIPENFVPKAEGVELSFIEKDTYAMIKITDWDKNAWETVPTAYQKLNEFVKPTTDWLESSRLWLENNRAAFEEAYEENGIHYMDVYFPMNK